MSRQGKTTKSEIPVKDFVASLEGEQLAKDSRALIAMMRRISGHPPRMWNQGTIGFDAYHYKYDSGREGDCHAIGFHPGKGKTTVYLMDGTARHAALLSRLGKHTATRVCVYIKRLGDVELPVLEEIVRRSYEYVKSRDGRMHRVE
jgi:hypothetical protein